MNDISAWKIESLQLLHKIFSTKHKPIHCFQYNPFPNFLEKKYKIGWKFKVVSLRMHEKKSHKRRNKQEMFVKVRSHVPMSTSIKTWRIHIFHPVLFFSSRIPLLNDGNTCKDFSSEGCQTFWQFKAPNSLQFLKEKSWCWKRKNSFVFIFYIPYESTLKDLFWRSICLYWNGIPVSNFCPAT